MAFSGPRGRSRLLTGAGLSACVPLAASLRWKVPAPVSAVALAVVAGVVSRVARSPAPAGPTGLLAPTGPTGPTGQAERTQRAGPTERDSVDGVTGLPDRRAILAVLDAAVDAGSDLDRLAVLLVDLNGFKEVNDSLGHAAGDVLLGLVAQRFRACIGSRHASLGRLGGDEFAVVAHVLDTDDAVELALAMAECLTDSFDIDGMSVRIGASTGVAVAPLDQPALDLLRCADVAMYDAKRRQRAVWVYRAEDDPHSRDRIGLIEELRDAIRLRQLEMHYQPAIDLANGDVVGVEALVRWNHPTRGLLYPDAFIPMAEQVGLITALTRAILEQSVRFMASTTDPPHAGKLGLSVNVSGHDLADDSLAAYVREVLIAHAFPAARLTLEITETSVAKDPDRARRTIRNLRDDGVRVAIDDFGVGYSSMSQLLSMSIDELKIDRSFVLPLGRDRRASAIIRSTVQLARALDLRVVAEGVETAAAQAQLAALGCDFAQGFGISKPLPGPELLRYLGLPNPPSPANGPASAPHRVRNAGLPGQAQPPPSPPVHAVIEC